MNTKTPASMTPKAKRLSVVAVAGAVFALVWSLGDWLIPAAIPPVVVSSVTSLGMLVAGFVDFRHADADTFTGERRD